MTKDERTETSALAEERRRVRQLRTSVDLACAVLRQGNLTRAEAEEMVAAVRHKALELFPDKGHVFDLVLAPRLQRIVDEVVPVPSPARILPFRGRRRKHR